MLGGDFGIRAVNFQTIPPKILKGRCKEVLLFIKNENARVVIPVERVYNIVATSCTIVVNYDGGEVTYLDDTTVVKKIESVRIVLDSSDDVDKMIRQFYKACNAGSNAFYFG